MTRDEAVVRLAPVVRLALLHAEDEVLDQCGRLGRAAIRPAYHLVVGRAEILTRIAVEVATEALAPRLNPLLSEAAELFRSGQSLHPAVAAALRESLNHDLA